MKFTLALCSCLLLLLFIQSFAQTIPNGKLNGTITVKDKLRKSHFLQYELLANEHTYTISIYRSRAKSKQSSNAKLNQAAKPDSTARKPVTSDATPKKVSDTKAKPEQTAPDNNGEKKETPTKEKETTTPAVTEGGEKSSNEKGTTEKGSDPKPESTSNGKETDESRKITQQAGWGATAATSENESEKSGEATDELTEAVFYEMSLNVFKPIFKELVSDILGEDVDTAGLDVLSTQVFFKIQARLEFIDDEPMTSRFILNEDKIWSFLSSNTSTHYSGSMARLIIKEHIIKDLEVEIEYGALKNITLRTSSNSGDMIRNFLIFKNQVPFSSSSKFDPESIAALRLFCQNCGGVENIVRFVKVGDLMTIDNILENHKEDYSPYNQTFILDPGAPIKEVRKERRSKIIDIAAFTDFNGFNGDKPNGLLQIEASRRINLNTKHQLLARKKDFSAYFDYGRILGNPTFVRMKKNRRLVFKVNFYVEDDLKKLIGKSKQPGLSAAERKELRGRIRGIRESYIIRRRSLFDRFIRDISPRFQYDEATFESDVDTDNEAPHATAHKGDSEPKGKTTSDTARLQERYRLSGYYRMKLKRLKINYVNWFGYFEPTFRFSKIEEQNKVLNLPDSALSKGVIRLNPINLYQHQKISLGGDINIVKLSFTQAKLNFYLNGGILWYQSDIKLEASQEPRTVTAYNRNLNLFVKFNPDGRWGCSLGAEYSRSHLLSSPFVYHANSRMLQYKFDAFLNTNNENKLFFRFRFNNQIDDLRNSFSQIQFGYSMNIFQGGSKRN